MIASSREYLRLTNSPVLAAVAVVRVHRSPATMAELYDCLAWRRKVRDWRPDPAQVAGQYAQIKAFGRVEHPS